MTKQAKGETDIYGRLLDLIEEGGLKPGERLREVDLAARFGVSRTPVREGLKRLEVQGLAVHEPNRGMIVARLDHDQLSELYAVREVLEGTVARFAAQHAAPEEIAILRDMVDADRARLDDAEALSRSNRRFHRQLTLASHNRYLIDLVDHLRLSLLLLGGTTFVDADRRKGAVEEHGAIVDAIAARDLEDAETCARKHISEAFKARIKLVSDP